MCTVKTTLGTCDRDIFNVMVVWSAVVMYRLETFLQDELFLGIHQDDNNVMIDCSIHECCMMVVYVLDAVRSEFRLADLLLFLCKCFRNVFPALPLS